MQPSASYPAQHSYPVDNKQSYPPPQPIMTQLQYPPGNYPQQYPYHQPPPQVYGIVATSPPPYATTIAPQPTYPVAEVLREWHRDIFGCFNNVPFCLLTMVFPCISHCIIAKKSKFHRIFCAIIFLYFGFFAISFFNAIVVTCLLQEATVEETIESYPRLKILIYINAITGLKIFLCLFFIRILIRNSRNITGTFLGDCCWMGGCCYCATCQLYAELKFAEEEDAVQLC